MLTSFVTVQDTRNMFDSLPSLAASRPDELCDELDCYLSTDPEGTTNPIQWWVEHSAMYPNLSRMTLDYLSIPGKWLTPPSSLSSSI